MSSSSFTDFRSHYIHLAQTQKTIRDVTTVGTWAEEDLSRDKRGMPIGWCVFAGYDGRNYAVFLYRHHNDREPMVRVGCRFFTLKEARKHWTGRHRNVTHARRRNAAQILMLIDVAIQRAHRRHYFLRRKTRYLDNICPKFDPRPRAGTKRKGAS